VCDVGRLGLRCRAGEVPLPIGQVRAQADEVEVGKGIVCARKIAEGTMEHRACSNMIAGGLVVKSYRELHQALEVPTDGLVLGQGAPDVFENFMSLEELGAVEERDAVGEALGIDCAVHSVQPRLYAATILYSID
jgi:hypothetical protein